MATREEIQARLLEIRQKNEFRRLHAHRQAKQGLEQAYASFQELYVLAGVQQGIVYLQALEQVANLLSGLEEGQL